MLFFAAVSMGLACCRALRSTESLVSACCRASEAFCVGALQRIIGCIFSTNVDLALLVSEWFLAEKNSTVCYIVMANPIYLDSCEG